MDCSVLVVFVYFIFLVSSVVKSIMSAFEKAKKVNRLHSVKKTTVLSTAVASDASNSSNHSATTISHGDSSGFVPKVRGSSGNHGDFPLPAPPSNIFPSNTLGSTSALTCSAPPTSSSSGVGASSPLLRLLPSPRVAVISPSTTPSSPAHPSLSKPRLCLYKTYASFKPFSTHSESPNAIIERGSPALMYFLRPQRGPYHPLPLRAAVQMLQLRALSQRPPSYVSEQEVMDFYRLLGGRYHTSSSPLLPSYLPSSSSTVGPALSLQNGGFGSSMAGAVTESHMSPSPLPQYGSFSSSGAPVFHRPLTSPLPHTPSTEDYRIAEMKKNARHIDNHVLHKVCLHYNTKEGCRRGEHCRFLHTDKGSLQQGMK